jgi:hypothetical protein
MATVLVRMPTPGKKTMSWTMLAGIWECQR